MKKTDLGPWPAVGAARGPLAWSGDELADVIRFICAHSGPEPSPLELPAEDPEEAYWRLFREEVEIIRELRANHPTAAQLAMSAEEITSYYRRLTPSPRNEAQRQADLKIVSREQPGRKPGEQPQKLDDYLALYRKCLSENEGNVGLADGEFVERAMAEFNVTEPTARNRLSEVKKRLSPDCL